MNNIREEINYILDRNASEEEFLKSMLAWALSMEKALAQRRASAQRTAPNA